MKHAPGPRSLEEWGRLLEIDPALLTPVDVAWFEKEDRWVHHARAVMLEVLDEVADPQWTLDPKGDA